MHIITIHNINRYMMILVDRYKIILFIDQEINR